MSDLLSAASLYLAALGLLYSAWYSRMTNSLELPLPNFKEDAMALRKSMRSELFGKALPIALAATVLALIILPDAISIIRASIENWIENGMDSFRSYDAVRTLFVAIAGFAAGLAFHAIRIVLRFASRLTKIAALPSSSKSSA